MRSLCCNAPINEQFSTCGDCGEHAEIGPYAQPGKPPTWGEIAAVSAIVIAILCAGIVLTAAEAGVQ